MTVEDRRALVAANKSKGSGRGNRREVTILEKSTCEDALQLRADRPFMTRKVFLVRSFRFYNFHDRYDGMMDDMK